MYFLLTILILFILIFIIQWTMVKHILISSNIIEVINENQEQLKSFQNKSDVQDYKIAKKLLSIVKKEILNEIKEYSTFNQEKSYKIDIEKLILIDLGFYILEILDNELNKDITLISWKSC